MRFIGILFIIFLIVMIVKRLSVSTTSKKQDGPEESNPKKGSNPYAKWIGGGLGWAFGGPIGGILGFAFGKMFEDMNAGTAVSSGSMQTDFKMSLLVLTAAVMKADGMVKKSELEYVKSFYNRNFGSNAEQYILMLREILKQEINVREVSLQISQFMDYPSRLQILHYLFGISQADGHYHPSEVDLIQQIAGFMGVSAGDYTSIRAMFVQEMNSAYQILEVSEDASDDQVRKAYREMAVKFHPDKVSHLGEEVRKAAEEKIQQVNAAYEQIKKQRGFK